VIAGSFLHREGLSENTILSYTYGVARKRLFADGNAGSEMVFGISATISQEIGSPPADPNPHRADNSQNAEKTSAKSPQRMGDAIDDSDIQTLCRARSNYDKQQPSCREDIIVPSGRHRLSGLALIPSGSWPRRMSAAYAAGYCGELTVEAFLKRVGHDYPPPRVKDGRRQLWLRDDLDKAILPFELVPITDIAEEL
jgi:hypothetical protein